MTTPLDIEARRAAKGLEETREVPDEIRDLLMRYKNREKLSREEQDKLFDYLSGVDDLLALVTSTPFLFSRTAYMRLNKAMSRRGIKRKAKKPEEELVDVKLKKQKEFVRKLSETMWSIGAETIMKWYSRAAEVGYYKDELKDVDMAEFVRDAVQFYLDEGTRIKELQQDNVALNAAIELLSAKFNELLERFNEVAMVTSMTEMLYKDVENLPLILAPIKSKLGIKEG